jgi:hypothetical protein
MYSRGLELNVCLLRCSVEQQTPVWHVVAVVAIAQRQQQRRPCTLEPVSVHP